jgi:hypothetical protein
MRPHSEQERKEFMSAIRTEWNSSIVDEKSQMIVSVQAINLEGLNAEQLFDDLVCHTMECETCLNAVSKLDMGTKACEDACADYRRIQKMLMLCDGAASSGSVMAI